MNISKNDDLDTRRELFKLLDHPRMTNRLRIQFLSECCQEVERRRSSPMRTWPNPKTTRGETAEIYFDIGLLFVQHGLPVDWTICRLAEIVRKL